MGRELVSGAIITNATEGTILDALNYSLNSSTGSGGLLTVVLVTYDGTIASPNSTGAVNVSYVANPDGFVDGTTGNIVNLILLFSAIAIMVFVVVVLFMPGSSFSELVKGTLIRRN